MKIPPTSPYRKFVSCRRAILVLAGSVASLIAAPSAQAASAIWNNPANTGGVWTTGTNWNTGAFPGSNTNIFTNTDTATFGTVGSGTIDLGGTINIQNITFGGATSNTNAATINANAFTIGTTGNILNLTSGGATTMNTAVTSTQTIAAPTINLSNIAAPTYLFINNSVTAAAALNITGNVVGNSTGATTMTLSGTNGGTVSGSISSATGTLALTKNGSGTWALTNNNTYTGTTTVSGGTLNLGGGTANGSIASASGLVLGNANNAVGGTLAYTRTGTNTQSFAATTVAAGTSAVTTSAAGQTVNIGAITRQFGGTVNFSGAGTVTTTAGNLNGILVSNAGTAASGFATVNGTDWAVGSATAGTAGTITAYNAYTVSDANSAAPTDLTANVDFQGSNATAFGTAGQGANSLRFNTAAANTLTIGTGSTFNVASTGILVTGNVGANTTTISGGTITGNNLNSSLTVIQNNTAAELVINSVIASNNGGDGVNKAGPGTLTLGGTNTFIGRTYVAAGTLKLGNVQALGASTSTAIILFAPGSTLDFNGFNPNIVTARTAVNLFGNFTNSSTTAVNFTTAAAGVNGASNNNPNGIATVDGIGDITFSAAYTNGRLVKNGNNTFTLAGSSSDAGTTLVVNSGTAVLNNTGTDFALRGIDVNGNVVTMNGGTLRLDGNEQIRSANDASTGIVSIFGGTFDINSKTETINGLQVGAADGSTAGTVSGTTGVLTIGAGASGPFGANRIVATNGTVTASLAGTAATFTKSTTATVTLSGANTYGGGTTINGGTLRINTAGTGNSGTGTGNVTVNTGGILAGTGQIAPTGANTVTVNTGGSVAPGAGSPGILTFNLSGTTGGVTMATGSTFTFTLGAAGPTIGAANAGDAVAISGASTGDLAFAAGGNVVTLSGGTAGFYKLFDTDLLNSTNAGDAYTNLAYDETTGLVTSGLTSAGNSFFVGTTGNGGELGDIYLQVAPVPEPGTVAMFSVAVAMFGVSLVVKRRRRTA